MEILFIVVLRGRESANRYGEMAFLALLLNENGGGGVKGGDFWLSLPKSIGGEMSGGGMLLCLAI